MERKFINNDENYGIDYDWRRIKHRYEKMGIPFEFDYIPWNAISDLAKYIIQLSQRSLGKTTDWILLGMSMNIEYGTKIQYIRQTNDMLSPVHADKLVEVIRTYKDSEYIKKVSDGKWNDIDTKYYHFKKQFYFCRRNEYGEVEERSEEEFMQCLSIDKADDYKSTYNSPYGDLIIFDEFISQFYRPNECVKFLDLTKTIMRDRISGLIVMLANTINLNSQYFEELEISREVKHLSLGKGELIKTELGTKIYVEVLDIKVGKVSKKKSLMNSLFYGFKNPKLASITGGEIWAFESVPHIDITDSNEVLFNRLFMDCGTELLKIQICKNNEVGLHLQVTRATKIYDDSIILTLKDVRDNRYLYGLGTRKIASIIQKSTQNRRVYYASNEIGSIYKNYINLYLKSKNTL